MRIIIGILVFLFSAALIYIGASFVSGDLSFMSWPMWLRLIFAVVFIYLFGKTIIFIFDK